MVRVFFCLLCGVGLLTALWFLPAEVPFVIRIFMGGFGVLLCFSAWGSLKHHFGLLRARRTEPVPADIFVSASPRRRGPDSLVAEINLGQGQGIWRGCLFGARHEHALAGLSCEGWAWVDPQTGAPLELKVQGKTITPIPIVMKVRADSRLENLIRKTNWLDDSNRPPSLRDDNT